MKLDFEIAVDQQTKARDRTFEGVPDSGCTPVPAGQPIFGQFLAQICQIALTWTKTMLWGDLLVASSLLKSEHIIYI